MDDVTRELVEACQSWVDWCNLKDGHPAISTHLCTYHHERLKKTIAAIAHAKSPSVSETRAAVEAAIAK